MTHFADAAALHDAARQQALARMATLASGLELVRFNWCDVHGVTRGKTLVALAAAQGHAGRRGHGQHADAQGHVGPHGVQGVRARRHGRLPGFGQANNLMLLADPASFKPLPWAPGTGWVQCQPWFQDGTPVELDTRRVLQRHWPGWPRQATA
jgi:glutamine synthetase